MGIIGEKRDGSKITPEDQRSRDFIIPFAKEAYDWDLIDNRKIGMIDLLFKDSPTGAGVEIEEIQIYGDYYSSVNFGWNSFLRDANPPINIQTLNIPPRKHHYWMNGQVVYPKSGNFWYNEVNERSNVFIRHNLDLTQVLVVQPEVILDFKSLRPTKVVIASKKAKKIYDSLGEELWIGIPNEYVERWDLINFEWKLSKWNVENRTWEPQEIKRLNEV